MKTKPLYLEDPYLRQTSARILEIIPEQEGIFSLILDQTVFYPMGGGQPTDTGRIRSSDGSGLIVYQVLNKDGEIRHYVKTPNPPEEGTEVTSEIDWERRYKNMKVHSAGHVIDFSLYLLGHSPAPLHPLKGNHGKKPFILYEGEIKKDIREELEKKSNELIAANKKFSCRFDSIENLEKEALYLQPGLPRNKPLRSLTLEGVGTVADGGTMVASLREVGGISVTGVDVSEGHTKVFYRVSG